MSSVFDTFIRESQEDLLELNNSLLALEENPDDADAIDAVFRVSHNLKGNFGAMGHEEPANLAHALEDLLDEVREGSMAITNDRMNLLFEAVDELEDMVTQLADEGEIDADPGPIVTKLRDEIETNDGAGVTPNVDAAESADVDLSELPLETLAGTGAADAAGVYRLAIEIGDADSKLVDAMFIIGDIQDECEIFTGSPPISDIESGAFDTGFELYVGGENGTDVDTLEAAFGDHRYLESLAVDDVTASVHAGLSEDGDGSEGEADEDDTSSIIDRHDTEIESIRVDVTTVDELYNQVEEMVTSRIKLRKLIEELGASDVEKKLDDHDKITSRIQDSVLEMRLIPLRTIVGHFPRLVRDLAQEQGKEINFEMSGVDIEMDRSILNEMRDPLVHLLRNAIDHGIEDPELREQAGKPRKGQIELRATHERDTVVLRIEDDGKGLDERSLRQKAIEKDIKTPEELQVMEQSEIYELIFHPGFSTNEEVTDISGRGVGMDVVNRVVQSVDGSVTVESEPGEGTAIEVRVPVSVAIVKVLFVEIGQETYGIPIKNIEEISALEELNIQSIDGSTILSHENQTYPVLDLGETLDVPNTQPSEDDLVVRIKDDIRKIALRCNNINRQEEVVIKPFQGSLSRVDGISGAVILGEGDAVMILDVETL
ncbi:chemotaxis protein CheA [Halobacteria archaeon AArc-dxtr1]|nr:chemotaxis protein CheA [Halobacteria archaeon AArc-dxtr1]